ncbi:MAG: hypothetical protein AAF289_17455, partial [Cyanobacteria bacterium P01_A01_bin.135]
WRYSDRNLTAIPVVTTAAEQQAWAAEDITFEPRQNGHFDVSFRLVNGEATVPLTLRDIDLSLWIPQVPETARHNRQLTQWFLTEREFNRQRVIFDAGSPHINLYGELDGYAANDISIALTNNCLGAGYWELAVSGQAEDGSQAKLYQGYFDFPKGAYAAMVAQLNPARYWQVARTMEAWPGFRFLSGRPFELAELRQVSDQAPVPITDLQTETIMAADEQHQKEDLMVYASGTGQVHNWADLREADLAFQSFIPPGSYSAARLWTSDLGQLETVTQATGRRIWSPLATEALLELEIEFESDRGEQRRLVVSGIDLAQVPQLAQGNYSDGVYMPLGFGTPFTQSYAELTQQPPAQSPFFSVLLDHNDRVINYRQDIGINGLVMHRDSQDPSMLHLYLMSYERITLVSHYQLSLGSEVIAFSAQ